MGRSRSAGVREVHARAFSASVIMNGRGAEVTQTDARNRCCYRASIEPASPTTTCALPTFLSHRNHAGHFASSSQSTVDLSLDDDRRPPASSSSSPPSRTGRTQSLIQPRSPPITSRPSQMADSSFPLPLPRPGLAPLASYSSLTDIDGEEHINVTCFATRNHASHSAPAPSPLPSTSSAAVVAHASTMITACDIPHDSVYLVDYAGHDPSCPWLKQRWKADDSSFMFDDGDLPVEDVHDTYPRPATSDFPVADLSIAFAQQNFSPLMHQTFTFALAEHETDEEDEAVQPDMISTRFYPAALDDLDIANQWSPPALRSASSASSLDPFCMELFSPTAEFPDAASVWDESYRSVDESSISAGDYSSSPFVGWSSSDNESKVPVLPLLTMGFVAPQPMPRAIPLHQPQPIRPIPPIPVHLLDELEAVANDHGSINNITNR